MDESRCNYIHVILDITRRKEWPPGTTLSQYPDYNVNTTGVLLVPEASPGSLAD